VVANCANPECGVPFRYFREGRLCRFDLNHFGPAPVGPDVTAHRRGEYFWLCGSCASRMTLISELGVGVRARSLSRTDASLSVSGERFLVRQAAA
jgi:hypothetical protein